jgi:hypothetical protein
MVEFPFVGPVERKGFCDAGYEEIYLRYHLLLTLILRHAICVKQPVSEPGLVCGKLAQPLQASMRG